MIVVHALHPHSEPPILSLAGGSKSKGPNHIAITASYLYAIGDNLEVKSVS